MIDATITLALLALTVAAAGWDLRTRRIPNVLTASGFLFALVLRAFMGSEALAAGLFAGVLAFAMAVPLVLAGGLGGGDAKLLAAVGAFVGPAALPVVLLVTALTGGILAVVVAVRRGEMSKTLRFARALLPSGNAEIGRRTLRTPGALAVPYAIAIGTGALAGWGSALAGWWA